MSAESREAEVKDDMETCNRRLEKALARMVSPTENGPNGIKMGSCVDISEGRAISLARLHHFPSLLSVVASWGNQTSNDMGT